MGTEIKAVIFDMDGVLIDAREWHYEALNRALELFGYAIGRAEHLETFDGLPTKTKLEMLTKDRGLPRGLHSFINEIKQQFTVDMTVINCKPTFIHQYALSRLKREGYALAVASNSIGDTVELMMRKARLTEFFDLQLAATDVLNPKPAPDIYLHAIEKLKLNAQEVLIVEDSQHGLEAAVASGAHVLRVADVTEVTYSNIRSRIDEIGSVK